MNEPRISPDDPKLTAYALGELEAGAREAVETAIKNDPAALAAVAEVRELAEQLRRSLATETVDVFEDGLQENIVRPAVSAWRRRFVNFPYAVVGSLAAACFVVVLWIARQPALHAPAAAEKVPTAVATGSAVAQMPADLPDNSLMVSLPPVKPAAEEPVATEMFAVKDAPPAPAVADAPAPAPVKLIEPPVAVFAEDKKIAEAKTQALPTPAEKTAALAKVAPAIRPDEAVSGAIANLAQTQLGRLPGLSVASEKESDGSVLEIRARAAVVARAKVPLGGKTAFGAGLTDADTRRAVVTGKQRAKASAPLAETTKPNLADPTSFKTEANAFKGVGGVGLPAMPDRYAPGGGSARDAIGLVVYVDQPDNGFLPVRGNRITTFPLRVGTASYTDVRQSLQAGHLPSRDQVRVEEMINAFAYMYAAPPPVEAHSVPADVLKSNVTVPVLDDAAPFAATLEVASAPWNPAHRLVRIGLKGRELAPGLAPSAPVTIARDVKLQVEFNPAATESYRLIGYENQPPKKTDRSAGALDGADVSAGETVTALYEVVPVAASNAEGSGPTVLTKLDGADAGATASRELLTLKVRYTAAKVDVSRNLEFPVIDTGGAFAAASRDFKFTAAVAGFGLVLRESPLKGSANYEAVLAWAQAEQGRDARGERREFVDLVRQAKRLALQ